MFDRIFQLPLSSPTLIFAVVLLVILFSPLLLHRFRIPYIVGLIFAGILLGPRGFNILANDESFKLFGNVGILYILFLAGIEMDMYDFQRNRVKGLVFGLFTFFIPVIIGTFTSLYLLKFSLFTSLLLAAMYSSQTLVAYPIAGRYGVTKNRAVNITVGGTILTDTLMLLLVAIVAGLCKGTLTNWFLFLWGIKIICFGLIVIFLFPVVTRAFMKRYENNMLQFIFVLSLVFLGAFLAQLAGLEGVLGSFLVGISLNRLIPNISPLKNRLEFVGNALFVPFFLIGVGMLIDYRVLTHGYEALMVAGVMAVVAIFSKWLAAFLTRNTFRLTKDEGLMIFGLSNAHAVATLAAVMVGYNIILGHNADGSPVRVLNDQILNGAIIMILLSCTISSFVTEKAARRLALTGQLERGNAEEVKPERVLISIANPATIEHLMELALTMKLNHDKHSLYALAVVEEKRGDTGSSAERLLYRAAETAAATDNWVEPLVRYDVNIANGILSTIQEHSITDLIIGIHHKSKASDSFRGQLTEALLAGSNQTFFMYKAVQPLGTVSHIVLFLPENCELEIGFQRSIEHIYTVGRQVSKPIICHAATGAEMGVRKIDASFNNKLPVTYQHVDEWSNLPELFKSVKDDDLVAIVMARRGTLSYHSIFEEITEWVSDNLKQNSQLFIIPEQFGQPVDHRGQFSALHNASHDFDDARSRRWLNILTKKQAPAEDE